MRPYYNPDCDVIFWGTDKAGTNHIVRMYHLYQGILPNNLTRFDVSRNGTKLSQNVIDQSKNVFFIRDPFKRAVSIYIYGVWDRFNGKYHKNPDLKDSMTFLDFTKEMLFSVSKDLKYMSVQPQTDLFRNHRVTFSNIMDIENIDYDVLEELFDRNVSGVKTVYKNSSNYKSAFKPAWNIPFGEIREMEAFPHYQSFYNIDTEKNVLSIYKKDFEFFNKHGFKYKI